MTRVPRTPRPSRGPKWLIAVHDKSGRMLGSVRFFNDPRQLQPGRIIFKVLDQAKPFPLDAFVDDLASPYAVVDAPKCYTLEVELLHHKPTAVLVVDSATTWRKVSKLFRQHVESHLIHGPFC